MMMLTHFAAESVRDFFRIKFPGQKTSARLTDDRHLEAAVAFITRSIEQGKGCASSKGYKVGKGWLPPYRETTGYIIPTLLDLADHLKRPDLALTAERLGEWLSELQEPSGGFVERDLWPDTKPIAFNTGQILHGIQRADFTSWTARSRPPRAAGG
jgi:hypothetical protein